MKNIDNKPRDGVSVDQLQSAQIVLVPQFLGKLTSVRIWDSQVVVDHFSELNYIQMMRIPSQKYTLRVYHPLKMVYHIWS